MDISKENYTEYSSCLITNKRIGTCTRLITIFVAVTMISSIYIICETHDELLAKKSTGNKSGVDGPVDETHCDKKGYPSCYDLGYSDGQNTPGTSCPSGHSEAYCNGYEAASLSSNNTSDTTSSNSSSLSSNNTSDTTSSNSSSSSSSDQLLPGGSGGTSEDNSDLKNTAGPVDETHCDKKGYPSCYDLGYSDGQNTPGTSCPSGHSQAYCNGYEAASLSSNSSLSPSFVTQNPKTKIDQQAESNANFNVSNSSGTRITNEQIIKQSVRINNEVNNLIRNNEVNNIVKENTVSAPQQPLTDLLTIKLNSSMSSGALFPLADVEPYSVIGGHITANLPSSSQQNIVVAQISDGEIQHAVILDLQKITGSKLDQDSLYETSLGSDISGTNPFTGNSDEVSSITNLFLWNNNQQSIVFDNTNGVTMILIYR
jgi:hypothetical protein